MSFAVIYPRTIRNGASFEEVADGDFLLSERQGADFVSTARDVGVNNHSVKDTSGDWRRRHGLRWTAKLGANFSEVFTRSGIIGGSLAVDAWFKGDEEITLTDGFVSGWGDLSGHGNDVSQNDAGSRPGLTELNGIQTIDTTANGGSRLFFASTLSTAKSIVFVVDNYQPSPNLSQGSAIIGENNSVNTASDHTFLKLVRASTPDYTISVDGGLSRVGRASIDGGNLSMGGNINLGVLFNSGEGPNFFYVDWQNTAVSIDFVGSFRISTINCFGALHIAEMILFPNDLTDQQRLDVYNKYLKPLWGLS